MHELVMIEIALIWSDLCIWCCDIAWFIVHSSQIWFITWQPTTAQTRTRWNTCGGTKRDRISICVRMVIIFPWITLYLCKSSFRCDCWYVRSQIHLSDTARWHAWMHLCTSHRRRVNIQSIRNESDCVWIMFISCSCAQIGMQFWWACREKSPWIQRFSFNDPVKGFEGLPFLAIQFSARISWRGFLLLAKGSWPYASQWKHMITVDSLACTAGSAQGY